MVLETKEGQTTDPRSAASSPSAMASEMRCRWRSGERIQNDRPRQARAQRQAQMRGPRHGFLLEISGLRRCPASPDRFKKRTRAPNVAPDGLGTTPGAADQERRGQPGSALPRMRSAPRLPLPMPRCRPWRAAGILRCPGPPGAGLAGGRPGARPWVQRWLRIREAFSRKFASDEFFDVLRLSRSSWQTREMASPSWPARPVRPMRCLVILGNAGQLVIDHVRQGIDVYAPGSDVGSHQSGELARLEIAQGPGAGPCVLSP